MAVLQIFVARHCSNCEYAYEVAQLLHRDYPELEVELIDIAEPNAEIPEVVFATPTYVLNGRVWSLGNPSAEKIVSTFGAPGAR